jgi:LmbE family N-acetylglucosaminyl deacetylase
LDRWLELAARDITAATARRSALVLAPHPDDETLGCGATVLRKVDAGARVVVLFATDGRHSHIDPRRPPEALAAARAAEAREACRRLGVAAADVVWLGCEETRLWAECERARARQAIAALLRGGAFDEVFVPAAADAHADHRALHRALTEALTEALTDALPEALPEALAEAGADAARGAGQPPRVYQFGVWCRYPRWWRGALRRAAAMAARAARRGRSPLPALRPVKVSTRGYLERKRYALAAHATQMAKPDGAPDWATLPEVEGGRFLARFFADFEVFLPWIPGISPVAERDGP